MLVSRAETATPARISVDAFECSPRPPMPQVNATATMAPAKASSGVQVGVLMPPPMSTIANVAPSPAPAATPSRYGSARGFRNTPW